MAAKIIEEQTHKCGYRTDCDVSDLYLGRRGLKEVTDLSRFRLLKYLWLNHNKISKLNFLGNNFRLTELYLNSNELYDITDLFHNPLEQDAGYRHSVIHHLPSVQLLDREHVTQKEKEEAFKLYNPHRTAVIQSLGFGRRIDSVPGSRPAVQISAGHRSSKSLRNCANTSNSNRKDLITLEDKVLLRGYQRSIMQFTLLDWNKIPVSRLKRTEEKSMEAPQLLTLQFR
ncbi:leucine-rich repeat-containing protein 72 isoform X2 [Rhinoderma darwinii]|uniref:leucine-rich repeat-containing protein 72 isoform X2 n=1 Tax=Rhinoderma darwinii TaxID=43563 RepID=UPI003F6645F1